MRQVSPPTIDGEQVFDDISTAKEPPRQGLLQSIRTRIFAAYKEYADIAPAVDRLPALTFTEPQAEALKHAYNVATSPMTELRRRLMEPIAVARCPFCGLGESSDLDHYLPKELQPQFAVLPINLVPACGRCNSRKSTLVVDENTDVRLFLHPYYDEIPESQFIALDVTLLPDAMSLVFRIVRPRYMRKRVYQHLCTHFQILRLADRYRVWSLDHLRGRRRALARYYGTKNDAARVTTELMTEADDCESDYGPNHWQAILCRSLAANAAFCDGGFTVLDLIQ